MDEKTELIKKLISNKGMSVRKFAENIGIPNTTLNSMLSRGIENASLNNVIKVCSALNISVETLYDMCNTSNILTNEENTLLESFNKLNDLGKNEANKRVKELSLLEQYMSLDTLLESINKKLNADYSKPTVSMDITGYRLHLIPKASYDKEGNFTEEDYKHDLDIMLNDDLWK